MELISNNNTEYQLTEKDWAQITAIMEWDVESTAQFDMLYHYYSSRTLKKVLGKDCIVMRLSAAENFDDKMEGQAVFVYYDLALEELKNEGRITDKQFTVLSKMRTPESIQFVYQRDDGWSICTHEPYEEYIICFSTVKDDPYMFNEYIHDSDGYCLHLFGGELAALNTISMENHAEILLIPILYGREVVEFIKRKLIEILSDPAKEKIVDYFIADLLHYVQFAAKLKKYAKEHEVRLVVFLPKDHPTHLQNIAFFKDEEGRRFINLSVPKYLLYDVSPAPYNAKHETKAIRDYLQKTGYDHMLFSNSSE